MESREQQLFMRGARRLFSVMIWLLGGGLFLAVVLAILKDHTKADTMFLPVFAACLFACGLAAHWLNRRTIPPRLYWSLIAAIFLVMIVWHYYCARELQVDFVYGDSSIVIKNARSLVLTGDYVAADFWGRAYFAQYQNQFGLLLVYRLVFQLTQTILHTTDDFCLVVLNQIAMDLSVWLVIVLSEQLGREIKVKHAGLMAAVVCLFAPFIAMYVPLCYTDVLCMPFILGSVLMAKRLVVSIERKKALSKREKLMFVLLGIFIAVGYKIKGNLIIMLAAVIIAMFFRVTLRQWISICVALVIGFGVLSVGFGFYIKHSGLLTAADSDRYQFPITHWIMMDMDSYGAPDADVKYTRSFESLDAKKAAVAKRMSEKMKKLGVSGLLKHMFSKASTHAWNRGTFNAPTYLGDIHLMVPLHSSWMHDYILKVGPHNKTFAKAADHYWFILLLPMALSVFSRRVRASFGALTTQLFLIGTMMFFMLWETDARYISSASLPVAVLAVVQWPLLAALPEKLKQLKNGRVIDWSIFLRVEQNIAEETSLGRIRKAEKQLTLYGKALKTILPEKEYPLIQPRLSALRGEIDKLENARLLKEDTAFYLELWQHPDESADKALQIARKSGEDLLARYEDCGLTGSEDHARLRQKAEEIAELIEKRQES